MQNNPQTTPSAQKTAAKPPKPVPPPEFQAEKIDSLDQPELIKLLNDAGATIFQKAKACQRLSRIGTGEAVAPLAKLLNDSQLATYARNGIQAIPGPSSDAAFRDALPKLKGKLQVGVINSISFRKDTNAVPALSKLLYAADGDVAQAAAAALGNIGNTQAAHALRDGLRRTKAQVRTAVADGCLICAENLLTVGEREEALALYNSLTAIDMPKPARLAAMHGIIAAETSLSRPR